MPLQNAQDRYGLVAKLFHWIAALLILDLIVMGVVMGGMPDGAQKVQIFGAHKMLGMVALVLVLLRLSWRLIGYPAPALPHSVSLRQRRVARIVQALMYVLMVAVPVMGVLMSQAAGKDVPFLFSLPVLIDRQDEATREMLKAFHGACAFTLIALAIGHAAMGLIHHWVMKDDVLRQMTRYPRSRKA